MDATALAEAIRDGRSSAAAAMEASLAAAAARADLGAIVRLDARRGRAAARAADAVPAAERGAFHGVPFLAKDLGSYAAGLCPAAGSPPLRRLLPDPAADAPFFARLHAAGLVTFGLTTTPEFGLALTAEPPGGPVARNPFDPDLSPGGSSGGAAAAVAAGIVAIAHATDGAGSTRVPAACCGLVGLKPSRGATPMGPGFENHLMGLVGELVLARSVRDVAAAFAAVAGGADGPEGEAVARTPPARPRVRLHVPPTTAPANAAALRAAGAALADLGCLVREEDPSDLLALGARAAAVAHPILAIATAEGLDALGLSMAEVSPIGAAVAEQGRRLSAPALFALSREAARIADALGLAFHETDVILAPVLADGPPRVGHFDPASTDAAGRFAAMEALAPGVALANVAGAPALALPFGSRPDGLPAGVQLIGPLGGDRALLALAARLAATAPPIRHPGPVAGLAT